MPPRFFEFFDVAGLFWVVLTITVLLDTFSASSIVASDSKTRVDLIFRRLSTKNSSSGIRACWNVSDTHIATALGSPAVDGYCRCCLDDSRLFADIARLVIDVAINQVNLKLFLNLSNLKTHEGSFLGLVDFRHHRALEY